MLLCELSCCHPWGDGSVGLVACNAAFCGRQAPGWSRARGDTLHTHGHADGRRRWHRGLLNM